MTARADHRAALAALPPQAWRDHLLAGSGLPGPRANLELIGAFADAASAAQVLAAVDDAEVYVRCCGVVGLGRLLAEAHADPATAPAGPARLEALLDDAADDASWRVREAAAMAAQRLGDADPAALRALVARWAADPRPLVRRAAAAAVCEPRLLADPVTATLALEVCGALTAGLAALPADVRRDPDVRTLRQALGYCWSVAVAADPADGLPLFSALDEADPDVAWVVRENRRKSRLARLLDGA